jgi:hypothetical protein
LPYSYGVVKTIDLSRLNTVQLWPLLTEARAVGVRFVQAGTGQEVHFGAAANTSLDVTTDRTGALMVRPLLDVDDAPVTAAAFIGSPACGVAYVDTSVDHGLRLAPLDVAAPTALQRLVLRNETLVIPAESADQFAFEYYPRLRAVAAVTSSDGSFTPPEITGPVVLLHADYRAAHQLALTWFWSYRLGDKDFRIPIDSPDNIGVRDMYAERELASGIDAPLEWCGLRDDVGTLTATTLCGVDTIRFATELQPLLAGTDGVTVEVTGQPADYREAGGSLRIGVSIAAVTGETDWFDLRITISVEGKKIPLPQVLAALTAGHDYLLPACSRTWPHWPQWCVRPRNGSAKSRACVRCRPSTRLSGQARFTPSFAPTRTTGSLGWQRCTNTGSVGSSPTTWAWARRCRRWR